jgi:hypothetical protein
MQCTNTNRVRTILSQFDNVVKKDYARGEVSFFFPKTIQRNTKQYETDGHRRKGICADKNKIKFASYIRKF